MPSASVPAAIRPIADPGVAALPKGSVLMMLVASLVLFTHVGRVFDRILVGYHLPSTISVLALLAALVSGGVAMAKNRVGLPLLMLIGWMFLCVPFSTWRGDSASEVIYFSFYAWMWLPVAIAPRNHKDLIKIFALFTVINLISLMLTTNDTGGRLRGADESTFSNSEDIALIGLLTIPHCLLVASRFRLIPVKVALALPVFFFIMSIARTGSRAGLLTAALMVGVYFLRSNAAKKAGLILALLVSIPVLISILPSEILYRLSTVREAVAIDGIQENATSDEALNSAAGRRQLLWDSIRITLEHPVFGVGPGQFAQYRWNELHISGIHAGRLVTHNAYTQISSELGIPGLLLFVALLVGMYRTIQHTKRLNVPGSHPNWQLTHSIAIALELNFVAVVAMGFFLADFQYFFWYLIGGMILALERLTRQGISQQQQLGNLPRPQPSLPQFATAWKA